MAAHRAKSMIRLTGEQRFEIARKRSEGVAVADLARAYGVTPRTIYYTLQADQGRNPFAGRSMSERTEETALLPEDEARRMALDDIVMVVDAQMPVRAKRIKYYEDRFFKAIYDQQSGPLPYPSASQQVRGLEGQIKALEAKVGALEVPRAEPNAPVKNKAKAGGRRRVEIDGMKDKTSKGAATPEPTTPPDTEAYQKGTRQLDKFLNEAVAG